MHMCIHAYIISISTVSWDNIQFINYFRSSDPRDPPSVITVRNIERMTIQGWIDK